MFFFKFRSVARATLAALVLSSVTSIPSVASAGLKVALPPVDPPRVPGRLAPTPVVPVVPWEIPDKAVSRGSGPCDTNGKLFFGDAIHVMDVGANASGCTAVDVNKDGHLDLISAASGADKIRIKFGTGNGTFNGTHVWNMGDGSTDVEVGDFNDDGFRDIICTNVHTDKVRIRWGAAANSWSQYSSYTVGEHPWRVAVGDVNDDGRDDFVTVNLVDNTLTVRMRLAAGGFTTTTLSCGDSNDVKLADMDNDGDLDIVYPSGIHNSTVK